VDPGDRQAQGIPPAVLPPISLLPLPPLPQRDGCRISLQAPLDEILIEIHPIGQDHVSNGALVLAVTIGLDGDFLPEDQL
jgi:hypothetical protein